MEYEYIYYIHSCILVVTVRFMFVKVGIEIMGYNLLLYVEEKMTLYVMFLRRAIVQKCPNPPMKNLVSIGGQHQGNICFIFHNH